MPRGAIIPGLILIALAATAGAAEHRIADLRIVAEARPTAVEYTWNDTLGARHGSDSFTRAGAIGLGGRWAWGSAGQTNLLVTGLDAVWVDEIGEALHRRGPLLRCEAGWGAGIADRWVVLAMPGIGIGRASLDIEQGAGVAVQGSVLEPSFRAGVRWNLDQRMVLGFEAGWLWGRDRLSGDDARLELNRSGGWVGLSLGWQLDNRPRRLE